MKHILFTSNTCKNCLPMKRNLTKAGMVVNQDYMECNVDEADAAREASKYMVRSLPSFLEVRNNKAYKLHVGLLPINKIQEITNA